MNEGHFVSTNTYFSSYYVFTALHGLHLLGGLFFWGKISSRIFKLKEKSMLRRRIIFSTIYLLVISFYSLVSIFCIMFIYNDSVIAW